MKVVLHRSITTSRRVGFIEYASSDAEQVPVQVSMPKAVWLDMDSPERVTVEITTETS